MKQRRLPFERMQNDLRVRLTHKRRSGFSLVEISLALAIAAFAFVAMLGLIPSGLGNFRTAMNTQTASEIYRQLSAEYQETDFDVLLGAKVKEGGTNNQFYQLPLRHFDEQGQEVRVSDPENPTTNEISRIVYTARARGSKPGDPNPEKHSPSVFTSLPGGAAPRFNPRDSTFLTVQVVLTQGRSLSPVTDQASFLVDGAIAAREGMPVKSFSLYITRNGYAPK